MGDEKVAVPVFSSLRELVSGRRRLLPPADAYPAEPWRIVERRFLPELLPQMETIFSTSNGFLGIRATPDEGAPVHDSATYLNGFYETWPIAYAEEAHGFPRFGQTMLRVPDGTLTKLYIDDEPFELGRTEIVSFERVLDLRAGTLERTIEIETPDRKRLRLHSCRFASFEHRHLACISYQVEMLSGSADLTLSSELVLPVQHSAAGEGDPRKGRSLDGRPLLPTNRRSRDKRVIFNLETRSSGLRMACAMDHVVESEQSVDVEEAEAIEDRGRVVFLTHLDAGERMCVVKLLAYHHSDSAEAGELRFRTHRTLDRAVGEGFAHQLARQRSHLDAFWDSSDIEVGASVDVQQAVRFNLFQMFQTSARAEGFGIPAKGLSGPGYDGHYFWDTEVYLLPFLVYTRPHAARNLLLHRATQLDAARRNARQVGQRGALFPWRTINGEEASAYYAAGTAQYHIDADIVFAAQRYVELTGDVEFLVENFAEIAVETARLWVDLGFYSSRKSGRFCINGVTGPDEYNAVVNNNAYTNLMARQNLRIAVNAVELLRERSAESYERLVVATGLDSSEIAAWRRAADLMYVPYDERACVHLQHDGFLDLELWDFEGTPSDHYPLLLHYHPLVIYRHQVIKQADLVLATFLLSEEFSEHEKRRIFDYYDPITTGDSSLSVCVQSIMAAEIGYDDTAYRYFVDAVAMDLGDVGGNVRDGLHIASLGGTWLALVHGFAGLRDQQGSLRFRPRLPNGWTHLRFRLRVRNSLLEVDIGRESICYRLLEGQMLEIEHEGKPAVVKSESPLTFAPVASEEE